MAQTVGKPSLSWLVLLGAGLAVASSLVLLAGPLGYRLGILPLRVAMRFDVGPFIIKVQRNTGYWLHFLRLCASPYKADYGSMEHSRRGL